MANYCATTRSNYFRVKDVEAFKRWLETWGSLRLITDEKDGEILYGFYEDAGEGLPIGRYVDESDEWDEVDFVVELAMHLVAGEVAVILEAGAEKLRYVGGRAIAVNSEGKTREIRLSQIYDLARQLGPNITGCED